VGHQENSLPPCSASDIECRTVELRHIRYFIAVAEYLNFRKAAQRLHIAQPPLSRQIRQLEETLGVELFARDKRRVELTKAGHAFLEEARKLMVQAGHAMEAARLAQRGEADIIKIGIASGLGGVVSRVVFDFRKRWSDIEVECRDIFSNFQSSALSKREIDVGFLRPPLDHLALDCELLYEEEFVVIVPKTHRLAKRRSVRMHDIAEEPLIVFDRNFSSGLYDKILSLYSRHGLTPRLFPRHVEAHEEAGAIMVASGKAIFMGAGAIVNRSVAGIQLASVRLNEPEAKIEVYAAWRKDEASASIRRFLDCMRSTLATHKHKHHATRGSVITSHFPHTACQECAYARSVRTGR
jgi:DNA-binding transcriptional LysR family regulator